MQLNWNGNYLSPKNHLDQIWVQKPLQPWEWQRFWHLCSEEMKPHLYSTNDATVNNPKIPGCEFVLQQSSNETQKVPDQSARVIDVSRSAQDIPDGKKSGKTCTERKSPLDLLSFL